MTNSTVTAIGMLESMTVKEYCASNSASDRRSVIKEDFKDASKGGVVLKPDNTDVPNTNTSSNDELNTHKIDKDTEAANENPTDSVLIDLLEYIKKIHIERNA